MKFIWALIVLLSSEYCYAQTEWRQAIKCTAESTLPFYPVVSVSKTGEVTVAGSFTDSIQTPAGTKYSAGRLDMMVSHYAANGQLLWVRTGGGPWDDKVTAVAEDAQGNIYTLGDFVDTAYFEGSPLYCRDTIHASPVARGDIFIIKYDKNGNYKWSKQAGSIWEDDGLGICIDKSYNIYITGYLANSYQFLPIQNQLAHFDALTLPITPDGAMYIAKYDTSGNAVWLKTATKAGVRAITADDSGNIYVTGPYGLYFQPAHFDNITLNTLNSNCSVSHYVAKYDRFGNAMWADGYGGERNGYESKIAVDKRGNVYATSYDANQHTYFSNGTVINGHTDIFNAIITKHSPTGTLLWAKNAGINEYDYNYFYGIAVDKNSNVFLAGSFSNECDVGPTDTLYSYGGSDILVCKYDSTGAAQWSTHAGSAGSSQATDMVMDTAGTMYVTGTVSGTPAKFGALNMTNNSGRTTVFLAKLAQWPLGVKGDPAAEIAAVYPNPSTGLFTLKWLNGGYDKAIILNAAGVIVATQHLLPSARSCTFFQPSLPAGVYSVGLQDGARTLFTKLVIRH